MQGFCVAFVLLGRPQEARGMRAFFHHDDSTDSWYWIAVGDLACVRFRENLRRSAPGRRSQFPLLAVTELAKVQALLNYLNYALIRINGSKHFDPLQGSIFILQEPAGFLGLRLAAV